MGLGSKIKEVLIGKADKIIEATGNALDQVFTSKEEKDQKKNELEKIIRDSMLELEKEANKANEVAQKELTERLRIDMASDSKLSKNIRPMTLVYLLVLFTIIMGIDSVGGLNFQVDEGYKEIIKYLLMSVFSFYFVGRMVEKWKSMDTKK